MKLLLVKEVEDKTEEMFECRVTAYKEFFSLGAETIWQRMAVQVTLICRMARALNEYTHNEDIMKMLNKIHMKTVNKFSNKTIEL